MENHDHTNTQIRNGLSRAFLAGIILNALFVVVEIIAGLSVSSLALLTDAGHNLGDVASLALAFLAYRLAKIHSTETYSYGFQKSTILVALLNAVILLIAIGGIGVEAVRRLLNPHPMEGLPIALVAAAGIVINTATALFFYRERKKDLNIKGAYLHMMADAGVSLGVVIAGLLIIITHFYWLDSLISFAVIIVIFISTWSLLRDTVRLSLDGTPRNINPERIRKAVLETPGVNNIHHIHIWAISTTKNAMTAHLVIDDPASAEEIKNKVKILLKEQNIHHCTLETESGSNEQCEEC
ncbi:MAG: cation diffusion facilitator family transporter [Bacteroidota bacterium]|nr:cation diffusion facilitator family transporter [Bacteroidota bacterium]